MTLDDAVGELIAGARTGVGRSVHLCNAYTLSLATRDQDYAELLNRGDLNLTDGTPLVWLGRRLGFQIDPATRPRGCDVFTETVVAGQPYGLRHYLYGATPDVVARLGARLRRIAPVAEIVGEEAPPFRPLTPAEEDDLVDRVRDAGADVVWVGIGTPKQDVFVDAFRHRMGATLVAVGAAFDFLAGTKKEAPAWMKASGMEWAYRFGSEPRRLWKRYLVGNAVFVSNVMRNGVIDLRHV
jgi:N-acetylglucosaminyldiphosphoundecaprenol N-acetyl-beta-D-mannosaminyltransferase